MCVGGPSPLVYVARIMPGMLRLHARCTPVGRMAVMGVYTYMYMPYRAGFYGAAMWWRCCARREISMNHTGMRSSSYNRLECHFQGSSPGNFPFTPGACTSLIAYWGIHRKTLTHLIRCSATVCNYAAGVERCRITCDLALFG